MTVPVRNAWGSLTRGGVIVSTVVAMACTSKGKSDDLPPAFLDEPKEKVAAKTKASPQPVGMKIVGANEYGLAAAKVRESEKHGVPLVVHGHGLGLVLRPPALAIHQKGALVIGRRDKETFVVRATITPGKGPASKAPKQMNENRTFATGDGGPTVRLEPQVASLNAVFASVALLEGTTSWRVVGQGNASLPLPQDVLRSSVAPDGPSTFTLRPEMSAFDHIEMNGPYPKPPRPEQLLFGDARTDGNGRVAQKSGHVVWHGVAYEYGGESWKQRFYVLPLEGGGCMTLKTQVRASAAGQVFAVADVIAAGYEAPRK